MRKFIVLCVVVIMATSFSMAQSASAAGPGPVRADSAAQVKMKADSVKMAGLLATAQYPFIRGGKWSGVIPVAGPTEIPDPDRDYKLLFEFVARNPDSLSGEINSCLDEVARILNLHVASGIPAGRITPVVVIHGPGIEAVTKNDSYLVKRNTDNPNLGIVRDLENAGAKFIVCGQAMAFFGFEKEMLLPGIRISLTAQTVLSNYQLQGYVLYKIDPEG